MEIIMSMYEETVRQWIEEIQEKGKFKDAGQEARDRVIQEYARRLEEIFHEEVSKQLEKSGKAQEFERMLLYDTQYMNKYLNQTIPGFPAFRMEVFDRAKKIILGE
jgi:hypothetical protein